MAVPYPSNFHWSPAVQRPFIWEMRSERHYLASLVGSTESTNMLATMLRRQLKSYCYFHPKCKAASYSADHDTGFIQDTTRDPHYLVTMHSIFCFQPLGDTIPRKGIFDSLSFGCIPVVFHPLSTSGMYTHHWPGELWKQIVVEIEANIEPMNYTTGLTITGQNILRGNPLDILEGIAKQPKEIAKRQKLIREHAFELQYGLSGYEKGSTWPLNVHGAPVQDAFDKTMDLVLGVHSGKRARQAPKEEDSTLVRWRNELPFMISPHFNLSMFPNETSPLEYGESLNIVFKDLYKKN